MHSFIPQMFTELGRGKDISVDQTAALPSGSIIVWWGQMPGPEPDQAPWDECPSVLRLLSSGLGQGRQQNFPRQVPFEPK